MFDAKLDNGHQMKKIVNALKELIDHASWDLTEDGIQLQSMDSSHVALVQMMLKCENFEIYRCSDAFNMGLNMTNLNKIFGAFTSGSLSIQCEDDSDTVKFIFEDEKNNKSQKYWTWRGTNFGIFGSAIRFCIWLFARALLACSPNFDPLSPMNSD